MTHRFIVPSTSRLDLYEQIGQLPFPVGTNFAGEWQIVFTQMGNIPEEQSHVRHLRIA